eukprot:1138002-Pelagomonas_calceolata.AAC.1
MLSKKCLTNFTSKGKQGTAGSPPEPLLTSLITPLLVKGMYCSSALATLFAKESNQCKEYPSHGRVVCMFLNRVAPGMPRPTQHAPRPEMQRVGQAKPVTGLPRPGGLRCSRQTDLTRNLAKLPHAPGTAPVAQTHSADSCS